MVFNERYDACPVCGLNARVTRKWVLNRYGKRFDYFIYHHQGITHYFNQNAQDSRIFKKGQLEKILIETINSQDFKLGSFRIKDLKKLLMKEYPEVGFGSIKVSLNRLAQVGIIERRKEGRNLHYINTVSKDRLSFIIVSLAVSLEDVDKDNLFKKHVFMYRVRNDHSWPLYYIPFRFVGDVGASFEDLELRATDPSTDKEFKIMLVEDAPTDKRVLLKFYMPLIPGEMREVKIEYDWSEPQQVFVFSAATKMDSFEFSVSANIPTKLTPSLISATRNETKDLTGSVNESTTPKWKSVSRISLLDVEPFSVLQLKWKPT